MCVLSNCVRQLIFPLRATLVPDEDKLGRLFNDLVYGCRYLFVQFVKSHFLKPMSLSSALIFLIFSIFVQASRNLFTIVARTLINGTLAANATVGSEDASPSNSTCSAWPVSPSLRCPINRLMKLSSLANVARWLSKISHGIRNARLAEPGSKSDALIPRFSRLWRA